MQIPDTNPSKLMVILIFVYYKYKNYDRQYENSFKA